MNLLKELTFNLNEKELKWMLRLDWVSILKKTRSFKKRIQDCEVCGSKEPVYFSSFYQGWERSHARFCSKSCFQQWRLLDSKPFTFNCGSENWCQRALPGSILSRLNQKVLLAPEFKIPTCQEVKKHLQKAILNYNYEHSCDSCHSKPWGDCFFARFGSNKKSKYGHYCSKECLSKAMREK